MNISIIIPSTGPRAALLNETVGAALSAIKNFANAEIITVTGSQKILSVADEKVKQIKVDYNNVSKARNEGAAAAKGDILFFIDDDILITTKNIERFIAVIPEFPGAYLYNCVWEHDAALEKIKNETIIGRCMAWLLPYDSFQKRYCNYLKMTDWKVGDFFESKIVEEFSEAAFIIDKKIFWGIGGFNTSYQFGGEGAELLKRARAKGVKYIIDPVNIVIHNERDKYENWDFSFSKQKFTAEQVNNKIAGAPPLENAEKNKKLYGEKLAKFEKVFETIIKYGPNTRLLHPVYRRIYTRLLSIKFWKHIK